MAANLRVLRQTLEAAGVRPVFSGDIPIGIDASPET
jgi:hypothetical protein